MHSVLPGRVQALYFRTEENKNRHGDEEEERTIGEYEMALFKYHGIRFRVGRNLRCYLVQQSHFIEKETECQGGPFAQVHTDYMN